jgi:hypothetical protein
VEGPGPLAVGICIGGFLGNCADQLCWQETRVGQGGALQRVPITLLNWIGWPGACAQRVPMTLTLTLANWKNNSWGGNIGGYSGCSVVVKGENLIVCVC